MFYTLLLLKMNYSFILIVLLISSNTGLCDWTDTVGKVYEEIKYSIYKMKQFINRPSVEQIKIVYIPQTGQPPLYEKQIMTRSNVEINITNDK